MENKKVIIPKPPKELGEKIPIKYDVVKGPPQAVDLEEAVLGALIGFKNAINDVSEILKPEMFYINENRIIYSAILHLKYAGQGIDVLTISDVLRKNNKLELIGGDYYLISLMQRISSDAHIEFHARIIIQKYVLREIIKVNGYMVSHAYHTDPDIFDLLQYCDEHIARLKMAIKIDGVQVLSPEEELKEKMMQIIAGETSGIKSFVREFDNWCGGFQKRELIIIAARPGMGKTTIVIAISYKLAFEVKLPVAFFSLEMSVTDLMNRYASIITGISFSKIREGKVSGKEFMEVKHAFSLIRDSPLHLHGMNNYYLLVDKIIKLVKEHGVKIVFIDYVQLIEISENSKDGTAELRTITRGLKALANKLNIPIVILSQLDRSIDSRHDKRPLLNDLKMSGSLEEDADTIMFPFRPAYYRRDVTLPLKEMGRVELDIAKGRSIGTNNLECHLDVFKYEFVSMMDFNN